LVAVVAIIVSITVMVLVPAMVVLHSSVIAIPVAIEEARSIVVRFHPVSAGVHWTRPVSVVPPIAVVHGIVVTIDPRVASARTARLNPDYTRRRRRSNPHSDGNLCEEGSRRK
jgi:hypothetical protein